MNEQSTIAPDVLADIEAVADAVDAGRPELAHRVEQRASKAREALHAALGVQDIGVDLIRGARDAR